MSDGDYRETLERLSRRRRFGIKPGLDVVQALLAELGDPQRTFRSIHVTGSKGKGSVAAMAATVLTAAGRRTGLFVSPHLQSYRERIQIDRSPIPPAAVVAGLARVEAATERLRSAGRIDREPTFFEATTALAFDWFRESGVRDAVIEVGLGGRLDSTNVLDAPAMVITTIELEHTEILGPTIPDIAREKAGIFHPGGTAIVGHVPDDARREIDRLADRAGIPVWSLGHEIQLAGRTINERGQTFDVDLPTRHLAKVRLPLLGSFQPGNAALAIAAVDRYAAATGTPIKDATMRAGIGKVSWRARLERVGRRPDLYLDVAHTPESALALAQSLGEIQPLTDPIGNVVLFGCLEDKKFGPMLDALSPLAHTVVLVPVRSERSATTAVLRRSAEGRFRRIVVAPSVADGVRIARAATADDGFAIATGSDYLAGEVLDALDGRPDDEPDLSDPGRMEPRRADR